MKLTIANTGIHQDAEGRFSLNDLHRASGGEERHLPKFFLANQQTQDLITEISTSTDGGIPPSPIFVKKGGAGQGSYGCKELVYAYAMWISPKFHLQVIRTFDEVATGKLGAGNTARPISRNHTTPRKWLSRQCMQGVKLHRQKQQTTPLNRTVNPRKYYAKHIVRVCIKYACQSLQITCHLIIRNFVVNNRKQSPQISCRRYFLLVLLNCTDG